jgi:hypothetical protein
MVNQGLKKMSYLTVPDEIASENVEESKTEPKKLLKSKSWMVRVNNDVWE